MGVDKIIKVGHFKHKTLEGNLMRTLIVVYGNGITYIRARLLSSEKKVYGYKKIYTKFGKNLFEKDFALKFSSLQTIYQEVTESLIKENIDPEKIL